MTGANGVSALNLAEEVSLSFIINHDHSHDYLYCEPGLSGRKKDVLVEPKYNGAECPEDLTETKYCIYEDCPEGMMNWNI